jgi:hypothetical protein
MYIDGHIVNKIKNIDNEDMEIVVCGDKHKKINNKSKFYHIYLEFIYYYKYKPIGCFKLQEFPGCCGLMVAFNFESNDKNYTDFLMNEIKRITKIYHTPYIIGTAITKQEQVTYITDDYSDKMLRVLRRNKYKRVHTFNNDNTSNDVGIFISHV